MRKLTLLITVALVTVSCSVFEKTGSRTGKNQTVENTDSWAEVTVLRPERSPSYDPDNDDEILQIAEHPPRFTENEEQNFGVWVGKNLIMPEGVDPSELDGRTIVKFVVDKEGVVRNVEIERSVHPLLDREVVRLVSSSPRWNPGRHRGKNVSVRMVLPIRIDMGNQQPDRQN